MMPTTAASAVFSVRKKLFAPPRLAEVRSAISTAVLYSSRMVPVSSSAIDPHLRLAGRDGSEVLVRPSVHRFPEAPTRLADQSAPSTPEEVDRNTFLSCDRNFS